MSAPWSRATTVAGSAGCGGKPNADRFNGQGRLGRVVSTTHSSPASTPARRRTPTVSHRGCAPTSGGQCPRHRRRHLRNPAGACSRHACSASDGSSHPSRRRTIDRPDDRVLRSGHLHGERRGGVRRPTQRRPVRQQARVPPTSGCSATRSRLRDRQEHRGSFPLSALRVHSSSPQRGCAPPHLGSLFSSFRRRPRCHA